MNLGEKIMAVLFASKLADMKPDRIEIYFKPEDPDPKTGAGLTHAFAEFKSVTINIEEDRDITEIIDAISCKWPPLPGGGLTGGQHLRVGQMGGQSNSYEQFQNIAVQDIAGSLGPWKWKTMEDPTKTMENSTSVAGGPPGKRSATEQIRNYFNIN
jgi:hypothetical protein